MTAKSTTDAYLDLAVRVLRKKRWPLTAREILSYADEHGLMPPHLRGRTQHKTLNARISEHIREHPDTDRPALVYRVAPATYFLTELQNSPETPTRFRNPYRGVLRYKQVRMEHVLVCSTRVLEEQGIEGFVPYVTKLFASSVASGLKFLERRQVAKHSDVKKLISYTMVYKDHHVLSYRRGKYTTVSSELRGFRSIGFGGHINDGDFDLFSDLAGAISNGAAREMHEELGVEDIRDAKNGGRRNFFLVGLINIDETSEAKKNVAIVSVYRPKAKSELRKRELSLNDVSWLDIRSEFEYEQFEPWSRLLLRAIQSQQIRPDEFFRGVNW